MRTPLHAEPQEQQYDALDRLRLAVDPMGGQIGYAYDAQDNLRSVTDPRGLTTRYGYNGFDELARLQSPDTGVTTYRNDAAGNLAEQTDARGVTAAYSYDASNRLRGIAYPDETLGLSNDEVGNTVRHVAERGPHAGAVLDSGYSARNRLAEVRSGGVPLARYACNAFGERVAKWTGAAANSAAAAPSQQFVYDEAGHLLGEYAGDGTLRMEHLWLDDTPIAVILPAGSGHGGQAIPAADGAPAVDVVFVHPDHLDSPRVVLNPAGDVIWRWESTPFGDSDAVEQVDTAYAAYAAYAALDYRLRFPGQYYKFP